MTQSQFIQRLKLQPRLGDDPQQGQLPDNINAKELQQLVKDIKALAPTLNSAASAMKDFALNTAEFVKQGSVLSETISKQMTGLDAVIGRQQMLGKELIKLNKRALVAERRYASLNKTFGVTAKEANALGKQFNTQADALGISAANSMKYGAAIKKILPSIRTMTDAAGNASSVNTDFFKSLTTVQRVITTNMGLSEQAAERFTYFSTNQEQSASDVLQQSKASAEAIDKATGTQGSFAMITEEIGNTSEDVLLQFGRMPGRLELAVMKGKALGLSLAEVTKIGTKMLDIESSIGSELEYQLLSGQRLTNNAGESLTNKFREAALSGDANQQAETLNELLETQGNVLNDNVLARQKMADLLGMDEASLSRALMKRKLLENEGAEVLMNLSGDDFEEAAQQMLDSGKLSEKTFKELQGLGDQRTTETIMEESLDVQLDQLALAQLAMITDAEFQNNQDALLKQFEKNVTSLDGEDLKKTGELIRAFEAAQSAAGMTGATSILAKYEQKVEGTGDLGIAPNGGPIVISPQEGRIFQGTNNDGVQMSPGSGVPSNAGSGINMTAFAKAITDAMQKATFTVDPGPVAFKMGK